MKSTHSTTIHSQECDSMVLLSGRANISTWLRGTSLSLMGFFSFAVVVKKEFFKQL